MVQTRVATNRLRPLHRGVYLLGQLRGPLEPERAREMAAVLACGPGAVISHRSAAWLWDLLPRAGGPAGVARPRTAAASAHPAGAGSGVDVDVTVPGRARRRRPGIRAHRSHDLGAGETTQLDGIPITTPARTLRDLSIVVGPRELNRAAARAERRKLIRAEELASLVARHSRRRGAPVLRAAMGEDGGPALTRSEAEERFLDLVRRGQLPAPETNVLVRGHEVDFLWRAARLAVEVDGFGFHASRRSFENDRRRDAELAAAGVHVVRVTWSQIVREPSATLVRVAQALTHAGGAPRS